MFVNVNLFTERSAKIIKLEAAFCERNIEFAVIPMSIDMEHLATEGAR